MKKKYYMHGKIQKERLFCKPANADFSFFSEKFGIRWVSFDIDEHLFTMHDWVNKAYASQFWQMNGSIGLLRSCYQCILQNPFAHPFMGFYEDKMIAFFDVYSVHADELAGYVDWELHDAGFHLLMAPNEAPVSGLSAAVVNSFLEYYFSFDEAERMYAEPDVENNRSVRLLEKCGFTFVQTIEMSYKLAELHLLSKRQWTALSSK